MRGYIAMLVVDKAYRKAGIGTELVKKAVEAMSKTCDEVIGTLRRVVSPNRSIPWWQIVLETEVTNKGAMKLYENLGFVRDKRLSKYYLNGNDAYRLKVRPPMHYYPMMFSCPSCSYG